MVKTYWSKQSLAQTIGSTLWKGYEDLMETMKKWGWIKQKNLPEDQISIELDKREQDLIEKTDPQKGV